MIILIADERGQTVTCSTVSMSGPQPVIALLDMDCFYVQVETRDQPRLRGRPAAVVQYNAWRGGGIIAVNYEARAHGVTRNMRGEQAREVCPDIELVTVPVLRDKADLGNHCILFASPYPHYVWKHGTFL